MKKPTRLLAITAGALLLVVLLLLVAPLLFKDRIAARVKTAVNENLNVRVDWRDVGLTFFRDFPNVTLTLDSLTAVGVEQFQADTLAAVRHFRTSIDLRSALGSVIGSGGPIVVRAIELDEPRLHLIKTEAGAANWDVTKPGGRSDEQRGRAAKPMAVSLRKFEITDGAVVFDNRQSKLDAKVRGYDQTLTGDFSRDLVAIRTRADADTVSVTFAGIPYLNRVRLALTADVQADLAKKLYTLKQTGLKLNDLALGVTGSANAGGKNLGLDLAFSAPSTKFLSILSLVPAVYAHDFDKVKTSGTIAVNGRVKGEYGDSAFPSFAINTKVDNGAFQYPDLPLPARDIFVDLNLTNPGGSADNTVVKLDRFHLVLGRNPVDATMVLRTPVSDPDVDARVKGRVDLGDVRRTLKLEGIDQLAGTVAADASVRTRMSYVDRKQYEKVNASGYVDVANMTVKGKTLPKPLSIQQASLRLAPERAELRSFQGTVGSSDLAASGTIDNLLGFMLRDDTLSGVATVRSNRFNLDEWKSGEGDLEVIPVPGNIAFDLDATVAQLTYGKLEMRNARGRVRIRNQRATLEDFRMNTLGGEIGLTGFYDTKNLAKPTFDVGLKMTKIDIPSAFQAFTTVQMLAPVARYAVGQVTTDVRVNGALGKNMLPLFPGLSGDGSLQTSQLVIKDFPALEKVVDVTKLQFLDNPTMRALKAAFQIKDGRLFVQPFDVKLGETTMNVAGSNGLDQSLQYTLGLKVPRSMLGGAANGAISSLVSKAGGVGVNLAAAPQIGLGIQLGGTVTNPTVKVDVSSVASSVKEGVQKGLEQAATQKVDSAAARLVAEAEQKAAAIRQEAQALADKVKAEGARQADSLTARAGSNPLLQAAAKPAADQIRKESDKKATDIVGTASRRADSLVAAARRQSGQP
jgi:hypothetical protein